MLIFKKEKKVAKLAGAHVDAVARCLETAAKAVEEFLAGEIEQAKAHAKEVDRIESEADGIRRDIRDKLYSGAFLPLIREDVYKLVETTDKVCNAAEDCCDLFLSQRPQVPDDMQAAFLEILRASFASYPPLGKAMRAYFKPKRGIDEVRELAREVGQQESRVDTQEWQLTRVIFESQLDLAHKLHLRLALDHIVEVADRAEDASDQIELVSLKSVI